MAAIHTTVTTPTFCPKPFSNHLFIIGDNATIGIALNADITVSPVYPHFGNKVAITATINPIKHPKASPVNAPETVIIVSDNAFAKFVCSVFIIIDGTGN